MITTELPVCLTKIGAVEVFLDTIAGPGAVATIRLINENETLHVDSLDLSSAGQRATFVETACAGPGREHLIPGDLAAALLRSYEQAQTLIAEPCDVLRAGEGIDPATTCTDVGNGKRFARRCGARLRYAERTKTFYIYDGKRWQPDKLRVHERFAKETAQSIYDEARDAADDRELQDILTKWAFRSQGMHQIKAMIEAVKSEPGIAIDDATLDAQPYLLNVANGTLDLRTGLLRPHDPADLLTKLIPVDYDPDAPCPRWLQFLNEVFGGDTELITFVQRAVGLSLTGDPTQRVLLVLFGNGANGKSTLLETMLALFGDYGTTIAAETLMESRNRGSIRTDLVVLKGARLVSASEGSEDAKLDVAVVKRLTGGDTITARPLYAQEITFSPSFIMWLATNYRPIINESGDAIWDRMKLVPFNARFWRREDIPAGEEQDWIDTEGGRIPRQFVDPTLKDTLRNERPGILAWAVAGCRAYLADGLPTPACVQEATRGYRDRMDVIQAWLTERCEAVPGRRTAFADLYRDYVTWGEETNEFVMRKRKFGDELTRKGFAACNGTGNQAQREGIALKSGLHRLGYPSQRGGEQILRDA